MAEKSSSPQQASGSMPDPPPSYEQTMSGVPPGPSSTSGGVGGFKAPSQPIPPQAPQGGAPVIVQYVNPPNFGPRPVRMMCPSCQMQIETATDSEPGPFAWILAGVLCITGFWLCACIPCCVDSLNSVTHKCPHCKMFLGRYKGGL